VVLAQILSRRQSQRQDAAVAVVAVETGQPRGGIRPLLRLRVDRRLAFQRPRRGRAPVLQLLDEVARPRPPQRAEGPVAPRRLHHHPIAVHDRPARDEPAVDQVVREVCGR
jgi:hypothetical protein